MEGSDGEPPTTGSAQEKSVFEKATDIEGDTSTDKPVFKVDPPAGKFGSGDFGNQIHTAIGNALQAKYPGVPLILRVETGQTGVDVTVPDRYVPQVGFKYGEIKPNSESGQRTFNKQVQNWEDSGTIPENATVQPITYDADGTVHLGFKLNQPSK
jgi:hypothetical protein